MKHISIFLMSFLTAFSINAQQNISAVTISVNSARTPQITIDGREYNPNNSTADNKTTISVNNLQAGQHTLLVTRSNQNMNRSDRISTVFNLRPGYDMLIKVNRNGSLELIETKKAGISYNRSPMRDADFNTLLKNVKSQRSINGRRSAIANAFNATNNYFSTSQVIQLLQLVNSENFRLELAKSSYRLITDRDNFNQVYDLLNDQSSINELEDYAAKYDEDEDTNNSTTGKVAMPDADFNSLYRSIQQQWPASTQMNSLTNAFNNSNNYFTTYQARQLIQIAGTESNRLQLAKLSYRSITDPVNFSQMYNLFNSQSSKDELAAYVNNFNTGNNSNVAMSDANFNSLYQSIQQQWPASTQMNSLVNAFSNSNNYFATYQARQLIQITGSESNRLQLAKLSYRSITDPVNFSQMYNLFTNVPMSDANFNNLYQSIQLQFLPGEKMSSLVNVFNNTSNYFTSAQARQLIQLVSSETNRLQLAKLAYRTITDRNNFSQLYDLLISPAARNELDTYVKAYKG